MKPLLVALLFVTACVENSDSHEPTCGNNLVEGAEQCDDGNTASGDGCSATCTREPRCGDTFVDTNEQCDDGNTTSGDGCSSTCALECGDGIVEGTEQCDDGDTTSFDGCSATCTIEAAYAINAVWQIRNFAGTAQACPQGYDTAAVYSQPIDASGHDVGAPIIDLFTCSLGMGTTAPLYEGRYKVFLAIMSNNGSMTYASSTTAIIDLHSNKTLTTAIYTDAGYFAWAWQLIGATSNTSLTCAQAASGGVELVSTLASNAMYWSDIFDCTTGSGITAALPAGTYTISADVLDTSDQSIGSAPVLTNKQILAPNKITDLGTVTIPVDGK